MITHIAMRVRPEEALQLELIRDHLKKRMWTVEKTDILRFALDAAEREITDEVTTING